MYRDALLHVSLLWLGLVRNLYNCFLEFNYVLTKMPTSIIDCFLIIKLLPLPAAYFKRIGIIFRNIYSIIMKELRELSAALPLQSSSLVGTGEASYSITYMMRY